MNTDPKQLTEYLKLTTANAQLARIAAYLLKRLGYTYMAQVLTGWVDFGIEIQTPVVTKEKS